MVSESEQVTWLPLGSSDTEENENISQAWALSEAVWRLGAVGYELLFMEKHPHNKCYWFKRRVDGPRPE